MRRIRNFLLLGGLLTLVVAVPVTAQDEPYRDPMLPVEERVEDLLGRMTLEEKIGQMTLVEKGSLSPADVSTSLIGGVLSGGGGYPRPNTPEAWAEMVGSFQENALSTRLGIPIIYGVDAVHGHNNVYGATIFPHNIGLGATRNAELVRQIAEVTAQDMIATGIYWDYAPVLAPVQDIRWGRTYEAYGENTELVTELGLAFIAGLQGEMLGAPGSALATPKHYIGDGGTTWGTSDFGPNNMDRGDTQIDEDGLRALYLPPYAAAVNAGALSVMASFSSWNGVPMHAHEYLLTDVLKGELGFEGFIVSDWQAIDLITNNYYEAVVTSINAGVDMNMVPHDFRRFISAMTDAVNNGDIPMERIDDAVRRILRAKFATGLFEHPFGDDALLENVGSDEHRALGRQAVAESLVLLKNEDGTLPLAKDAQTILVAGQAADNIGIQSGGWTIEWQGASGDITVGTTILEGIQAAVSADTEVLYSPSARFDDVTSADVGIVVLSEPPYAESQGDSALLLPSISERNTIERLSAVTDRVVVILISGRPLIVNEQLARAEAFVAAWLPGTEGAGIADVLFGDAPFTGKLPFTWPRSADQLPFDFANLPTEGCDAPLFPYGYGLTDEDTESEWLDLEEQCSGGAEAVDEVDVPRIDPFSPMLAPDGVVRETYYAPFPVQIEIDGVFTDWAGVPRVTMSAASEQPSITFAAAADETTLYLVAAVADETIISGQHGADYWNEDSVEFYINGTGDLGLTSYTQGVVQITLPAMNIDLPPDEAVIAGIQGSTAGARIHAVKIDAGYAVELAVPLQSDIWDIAPEHGGVIGFQVHLNAASANNRDTKLIWSMFDVSDQSYLNPSVFGQLIFYDVR